MSDQPNLIAYRVSCPKFTGQVNVDGELIIREAPPVCRRFLGQKLSSLVGWLTRFGTVQAKPLHSKREKVTL